MLQMYYSVVVIVVEEGRKQTISNDANADDIAAALRMRGTERRLTAMMTRVTRQE